MSFIKYLVIGICFFSFVLFFVMAARRKKIFKFLLLNIFFGVMTLLIIYFLKDFIGVKLALNWYTVIGVSVLGIPAVIGFLILNLIV